MVRDFQLERRLSPSEMLWWVLGQECSVNFIMHSRVTGPLSDDRIKEALNQVQKKHPLLGVKIIREGRSRLRFCHDDVGRLPLTFVDVPFEGWVEQAEAELAAPFNLDQGPLVRCRVLRHGPEDQTLLIIFHHSVSDALSGAYLVCDVIQAAADPGHETVPNNLPLPKVKPSMQDYYPAWAKGLAGRWRYYKFSARMMTEIVRHGIPAGLILDRPAPPGERRPQIMVNRLEADFIEKIHYRARQENTTLHGALLAAQLMAMQKDANPGTKRPWFIGSPVNLRRRLEPPVKDEIGFFVTMAASVHPVKRGADFWELARDVRRQVSSCVDRGEAFVYVYQHQDLAYLAGLFGLNRLGRYIYSRAASKANLGGLGFSNIGALDIDTQFGSLTIQDLGFAASGSSVSPLVSFASTLHGLTYWNFVGMDPLLTPDHTRRIADCAMNLLAESV